MCICVCVCGFVCVCVCACVLRPVSKIDTKKFGALVKLETCNEEVLVSNIFINTNNKKFYFPCFFQSLHSNDISLSPLR